jgi:hypothetical protein
MAIFNGVKRSHSGATVADDDRLYDLWSAARRRWRPARNDWLRRAAGGMNHDATHCSSFGSAGCLDIRSRRSSGL